MFLAFYSKTRGAARELARSLPKDLPPKLLQSSGKVLSANRITTILERRYALAQDFGRENKLGLIGRAVYANTFRWTLLELGYSKQFTSVATEGLVVALSRRNGKLSSEQTK